MKEKLRDINLTLCLIEAEIDTRKEGRLTGRLVLAHETGEALSFALDLEGDVIPDLRGQVMHLHADSPSCGDDLSDLGNEQFRGRLTRLDWLCIPEAGDKAQAITLEWESPNSGEKIGLDFFHESGKAVMRRSP